MLNSALQGLPFVEAMPSRVISMEYASNDLWTQLRKISVARLQKLRPTSEYKPLIDALIAIRTLIGDGQEKDYIR